LITRQLVYVCTDDNADSGYEAALFVQFENELPLSSDALWQHLFGCPTWGVRLPRPNWPSLTYTLQLEGTYTGQAIVHHWESTENQTAIWESTGLLLGGCSCSSATAYSTNYFPVV